MENKNEQSNKKSHFTSRIMRTELILLLILVVLGIFAYWYLIDCEGEWQGETLEKQEKIDLNLIGSELQSDIAYLQNLGPRNSESLINYQQLRKCEEWIVEKWKSQGYLPTRHSAAVEGKEYYNIVIEIPGTVTPSEIVIISAQYDTLPDSPGANNNGSGVATLFQLSKLIRNFRPRRTVRLIEFVNEEDPFWGTDKMGSYIYAKNCYNRNEDIKVMLSLDAIGIYKNSSGTQNLPFPFSLFYPDRGNFLAFIGNISSRPYVKAVTAGFKKGSSFPIAAGVAPEWVDGVTWSDHYSFWKFGYPAVQITDTGGFRSASHTTKDDTMEKISFNALSRVVVGMYSALIDLAQNDL
jgi:Zn-dependent M28 family amino/carboxypeptidase